MKKTFLKQISCLSLALIMAVSASAFNPWWNWGQKPSTPTAPGSPENVPASLEIDWEHRYTYAELEEQLANMEAEYPDVTERTVIGTSNQERKLWDITFTNEKIPAHAKTVIDVVATIHGGERESSSSAMYFAWWLACNSDTAYVKNLLNNYEIHIVPVMNPDGYEQSFVINTRQNLRPRDLNGDGVPFSDPYTDIDGDGYIATLYRGKVGDPTPTSTRGLTSFGTESPDWDQNGKIGDDPRNSGIDMNRTFNHQWGRYDVETYKTGDYDDRIGVNAWSSNGGAANYGPASEPEVQAIQKWLYETEPYAMATLHTGIQCVLIPWCYRVTDENNPEDADLIEMMDIAGEMAQAYQDYTGRGFYYMDSFHDYTTSSEMIDYAYGHLGIHAYTIEVYSGGGAGKDDVESCTWGNTLPTPTWAFYTRDELEAMGLDTAKITDNKGVKGLAEDEGIWFYTSSTNQMVDKAPEDQTTMVEGCTEALLVMIEAEPFGDGPEAPAYYK